MAKKVSQNNDLIPRLNSGALEGMIATIEQNTTILLNSRGLTPRSVGANAAIAPGMKKNIQGEAGYATAPDHIHFMEWFKREGFAARVVELWPTECWQLVPTIYEVEDVEKETEWEEAWEMMLKRLRIWAELKRLDIVSGIGRFGLMVLGFDDGKELSEEIPMDYDPVLGRYKPKEGTRNLVWVDCFTEGQVKVLETEADTKHPRFGKPTKYQVTMTSVVAGSTTSDTAKEVHWTRTFHLPAEGGLSGRIYGPPRMERAFNRLYDILKIAAGSGEGYWQSANPTLVIESEGAVALNFDKEAMREQIFRLQNSLQKYLTVAGMTAKMLSPELNDPAAHLDAQLTLLCLGIGVPKRVFMGTEEGKLAGEQDSSNWGARVQHRRDTEVIPVQVMPWIYHMMACGALPFVEELFHEWPETSKVSDKEKAETAKLWTETLAMYADSPKASLVMPEAEYYHRVWQMTPDEVEELLTAAEEAFADAETDPEENPPLDPAAKPPVTSPDAEDKEVA